MHRPAKSVRMSKKEFLREHVRLVKRLRSGNKKALKLEADDQAEELREVKQHLKETDKD